MQMSAGAGVQRCLRMTAGLWPGCDGGCYSFRLEYIPRGNDHGDRGDRARARRAPLEDREISVCSTCSSREFVCNAGAKIADRRSGATISNICRDLHEARSLKIGVSVLNSPEDRIGDRVFNPGAGGPTAGLAAGRVEWPSSGEGESSRRIARGPSTSAEDQEAVERDAEPTADRAVVLGRRGNREGTRWRRAGCAHSMAAKTAFWRDTGRRMSGPIRSGSNWVNTVPVSNRSSVTQSTDQS